MPTDWMMGRIQRCPEITQARFMRLCCLYWNKECKMLIEDAEIEIDKEHLDILIAKKIILTNDLYINISFLDEQLFEVEDKTKDKSTSGIIGNLKRWHVDIYNQFMNKEITLENAIELSKSIATQSHTDSTPIATQSQNIAEKKRREEKRKEEIDFSPFGDDFKIHWITWTSYKKSQFRFAYKEIKTEQLAFNDLVKKSNSDKLNAIEIINNSMVNGWKGLMPLKHGLTVTKNSVNITPSTGLSYEDFMK